MKKNFTNEQIIYTLRQAEGGTSDAEVCRKTGITEQTLQINSGNLRSCLKIHNGLSLRSIKRVMAI